MNLSERKNEYLSRENTQALKGILSIAVFLCHVVPASKIFYGSILSPLFGSLGYLSVSVFFFLSAYGISLQYEKRKEDYLNNFPKNRILSIYFLNAFLVLIYGAYILILDGRVEVLPVLQSFLIGNTIVGNGWYLQVIVLFYLIWYLCTVIVTKKEKRCFAIAACLLTYVIISGFLLDATWFECTLSFLLGLIYQKEKDKIDNILCRSKKRYCFILILSAMAFAVLFILANRNFFAMFPKFNSIIRIIAKCLSSPMFVIFVCMCLYLLKLERFKILQFLGKHSIEIYVLHAIPLDLLYKIPFLAENGYIYILLSLVFSILTAILVHPIIQFVIKIPQKYMAKGG